MKKLLVCLLLIVSFSVYAQMEECNLCCLPLSYDEASGETIHICPPPAPTPDCSEWAPTLWNWFRFVDVPCE